MGLSPQWIKRRDRKITILSPAEQNFKRSVFKAVCWRVVGTLDTFILSFFVISLIPDWATQASISETADVAKAAAGVATAESLTKIVLYTVHEQIWGRIDWGMVEKLEGLIEQKRRSFVKTATWRVIAFVDTTFLVWLFIGDIATAFSIGFLEILTKMFLYYLHERIWNKIR